MSGGYFNYDQYKCHEMAESIACLIRDNNKLNDYGESRNYSDETIMMFKMAESTLRRASIMAHRIDLLVSGDDDEDSFYEQWIIESKQLEKDYP